MNCVIDVRIKSQEDRMMLLGLWGKVAFQYPLDAARKTSLFDKIYVCTNDEYVIYLVKNQYKDIEIIDEIKDNIGNAYIISGKAVLLSSGTITCSYKMYIENSFEKMISYVKKKIYLSWENKRVEKIRTNIFEIGINKRLSVEKVLKYVLPESESLILENKNDFELALVLIRKKNKKIELTNSILNQIERKRDILYSENNENICLIGHSQFDQWKLEKLGEGSIQNCGISGISSFEYKKYILDRHLFKTNAKKILMLYGTNDIVYDYNLQEIVQSIKENVEEIARQCPSANLYMLECLHVNGRFDRDNKVIDELNRELHHRIRNVIWIEMNAMDDCFGNLKQEYTSDGLHLSDDGYKVFAKLIKNVLKI